MCIIYTNIWSTLLDYFYLLKYIYLMKKKYDETLKCKALPNTKLFQPAVSVSLYFCLPYFCTSKCFFSIVFSWWAGTSENCWSNSWIHYYWCSPHQCIPDNLLYLWAFNPPTKSFLASNWNMPQILRRELNVIVRVKQLFSKMQLSNWYTDLWIEWNRKDLNRI